MTAEDMVYIIREAMDWQTDGLERIANALDRIAHRLSPKQAVTVVKILIGGKQLSTQAFPLTDIQQVSYVLPNQFTDEDNNPASPPAGSVAAFTSSDPTIVNVVPDATPANDANGNPGFASGELVAAGKLGSATISGQINDASGNKLFNIPGLPVTITVGASAATTDAGGFTLGTPVTQAGK